MILPFIKPADHYELGIAALNEDDMQGALFHLSAAYEEHPLDDEVAIDYGHTLTRAGLNRQARDILLILSHYEQPFYASAIFGLGYNCYLLKEYEKAFEYFKAYLRSGEDSEYRDEARNLITEIEGIRKHVKEKTNVQIWMLDGLVAMQKKDYDRGIALLTQAGLASRHNVIMHEEIFSILYQAQQHRAAHQLACQLCNQNKYESIYPIYMAQYFYITGDKNAAKAARNEACRRARHNSMQRQSNCIELLLQCNEPKHALAYAQSTGLDQCFEPDFLHGLALCALAVDDLNAACRFWRAIHNTDARDIIAPFLIDIAKKTPAQERLKVFPLRYQLPNDIAASWLKEIEEDLNNLEAASYAWDEQQDFRNRIYWAMQNGDAHCLESIIVFLQKVRGPHARAALRRYLLLPNLPFEHKAMVADAIWQEKPLAYLLWENDGRADIIPPGAHYLPPKSPPAAAAWAAACELARRVWKIDCSQALLSYHQAVDEDALEIDNPMSYALALVMVHAVVNHDRETIAEITTHYSDEMNKHISTILKANQMEDIDYD